ncbi:MAG: Zn-dependent oxidoreductase, NADPH:quinone reductase [Modestobacter sp.]|nr:Zn-dependent oxidoreductase, NADPH:quinone reductase [Modestobacter sp.]
MRAVQITRFGGPEVMDVVDLPDPVPGNGEQLFDISSSGVNFADTTTARPETYLRSLGAGSMRASCSRSQASMTSLRRTPSCAVVRKG